MRVAYTIYSLRRTWYYEGCIYNLLAKAHVCLSLSHSHHYNCYHYGDVTLLLRSTKKQH